MKKNKSTKPTATATSVATEGVAIESPKTSNRSRNRKIVAKTETVTENPAVETAPVVREGFQTCKRCNVEKEATSGEGGNFSLLQKTGKLREICKPCQSIVSQEWTSRPEVKVLRETQIRANRYTSVGIPTMPPSAKGFDASAPLMTIPHYTIDGKIVTNAIGEASDVAVFHPSENADLLFAAYKADKKAQSEQRKADALAASEAAKEANRIEREAKRATREAEALAASETAKAEREANRLIKVAERAEQAKLALAEKEQRKLDRQAETAEKARLAQEKRNADRQAKADAKLAEANEANLRKAQEAQDALNAKTNSLIEEAAAA